MSGVPSITFCGVEPTAYEFRCGEYPDVAIRVENVTSEFEACVRLRRLLSHLTRTDNLFIDVHPIRKARTA